ncbi:HAMP domain-containing histidine kinase [Membranicola marinus]|uniref:histidine kinase n=1 Tax=Membranihabitans marinus TaxID=1227546 RepID=A0A953HLV4_9BACT|nr:ATP-binding protein [Membranihabitans marinus]MBY5958042.1 HAMP domain-containing histidine kinase [Membranihabitans marinus]
MNLSFKNRIALYYMLATAAIIAVVFLIIYYSVRAVAYETVDTDLTYEAYKHSAEIVIEQDSFRFINKDEWMELEHQKVQVYPVFVQLVNVSGQIMDKSPNLKTDSLVFHSEKGFGYGAQFDTYLENRPIRQMQIPIEKEGLRKGYILTAMSLEGPILVKNSLRKNLLVLYPMVLIGLFFVTRFLAGRSIKPVRNITKSAHRITRQSLNERIPLPENKDELYHLTSSINELVNRMQKAIEREEQFTADASHQMRTPLAVIKGTLEVLIRKSRTESEYREKINYSIREIDRMSDLVEQLLIMARLDGNHSHQTEEPVNLQLLIDEILLRYKGHIEEKALSVHIDAGYQNTVITDPYYIDLIFENLISNAIKYSRAGTVIEIALLDKEDTLSCRITNQGILIGPEDIDHLFQPFYRADALRHKEFKGSGLGLSIVKKACDFLDLEIQVTSREEPGTTFELSFPKDRLHNN